MTDQLEFPWGDAPASPRPQNTPTAPKREPDPPLREPDSRQTLLRQAEALRAELAGRCGLRVCLRVTNNRSTMMSVHYRDNGKTARLSLHHMFLTAPAKVRTALVRWLRNPKAKAAGETINAFIRERNHQVAPRAPRQIRLCTRGRFHDLAKLYREVNAEHFGGTITAQITWGRMPPLNKRRSIRFGSYLHGDEIIRIHPLLDQDFVPAYFVRYVVYHEMLHAHLGVEELPSGRRSVHGKAFRDQEKTYPDYARATAWGDDVKNLKRLLRPHG